MELLIKIKNMKKRLFILLIALVGMTTICMAQIYVPRFQKIVKVTSQGVNLRESASTKCRKLLWSPKRNVFNWEHPALDNTFKPARAEYLLVIDETIDWIHAYALIEDGRVSDHAVYVSKSVCKTKNVPALTEKYIHAVGWGGIKTMGKFKNWATVLVNRPYIRFAGVVANGVGFGIEPDGSFQDEDITDNAIADVLKEGVWDTVVCIPGDVDDEENYHTYKLYHMGFHGEYDVVEP